MRWRGRTQPTRETTMRYLSLSIFGREVMLQSQPDFRSVTMHRDEGETILDLPFLRVFLTNHRNPRWNLSR